MSATLERMFPPPVAARGPHHDSTPRGPQNSLGSTRSMPERERRETDGLDASTASSAFDFLSYSDIDSGQREEFQSLLVRVRLVCLLSCYV